MLSEKRTSSAWYDGLDTLRSFAIVSVMLYHFRIQDLLPESLTAVARVGWIGVDLFFVLSGYLIGSQLLRNKGPLSGAGLREFYLRRAYRVLPAFLVVLLLYLFVPIWRENPGPYAPLQYFTFTWNLLLLHYPEGRAFSHIWSLCVEEHFYLVLPLALLALKGRATARTTTFSLAFLFLMGLALRACLLHFVLLAPDVEDDTRGLLVMKWIYLPTYTRLDGLTVGVALAVLRLFRPGWWKLLVRFGYTTFSAGMFAVLVALWACDFDFPTADRPVGIVLAFPLLAIGFGFLVVSALSTSGPLRHRVPGASFVAALAFSLYLTHKSVVHIIHGVLPAALAERGLWFSLPLYLAASVLVALLLYHAVERPFLRLRDRYVGPFRARLTDEVRLDPAL